jgi:hypothetical protein
MSFFDCLADAMDEGSADRERGERAQREWRDRADQYERQGHDRHIAEALAAEDVKQGFRREAGEDRHVYLTKMANLRKQQAEVKAAQTPSLSAKVEQLDYRHRGLVRRFNYKLVAFLNDHHRDLLGRTKKPAQMLDIVKELHGEASGDEVAKALADSIRAALEDMRISFNEAGGLAGKLDNWGLPHSHDRKAVTRAGFQKWSERIVDVIDWTRVEDPLTGRPMQGDMGPPPRASQMAFLKEAYDNIAYGRNSREAVYGRPQGVATYRKHSNSRVLHFKSAGDWIAYNKEFGSGDPFGALMGHVHRMARDITLMREFGPNPGMGAEYRAQLQLEKWRGDEKAFSKAQSDNWLGMRAMRVMSGGSVPQTALQDYIATFMSSARHVLTSAFLDRAIFASASDWNTMRLAASAVGMNPKNLISRHVDLMASSLSRKEAQRAGYVADTLSDAGTTVARFQNEFPPSEFAERLASGSMRVQGLSHWTDQARAAFQMEFAGMMADQAGKSLDEIEGPLRNLLKKAGVTEADWMDLTHPDNLFTPREGATFASPFVWRETTKMDRAAADDLFFKVQGMIEEQMEYAVPTQNILARAVMDPAAMADAPPGSLVYEMMKSGGMFKTFTMTFSINQYRRTMAQPTIPGRIGYGLNMAAGATVMGTIALQLNELAFGRDPQDMTKPDFWARAAMKGGGFGIIGDIVSTGQASWGGGFGSYLAGPIPQAAGDIYNLTLKNATELAMGKDTKFWTELNRFGKRYTPMGQTPLVGPVIDRLFWDQMSTIIDPGAAEALRKASRLRGNNYGNSDIWMPGAMAPSRGPDLSNAFGG